MLCIRLLAAAAAAAGAAAAALPAAAPVSVLWFDLDAVVKRDALSYEEQLLAYVFEGLVNRASLAQPRLLFNGAYINFDWPDSDVFWRDTLAAAGRAVFGNISDVSLCGLLAEGDPDGVVRGAVAYDPTAAGGQAREWALPIAATVASQQRLVPVTDAIRARFPCVAALPIVADLRAAPWSANASAAWEWAFAALLPNSSRSTAFNLYHFSPWIDSDPQSNATLANIDYAVQQNAFIMNFATPGNPATEVNPLFARALANMEPLFSMYGWSDNEFGLVWMTTQSGASPNGTADNAAAGGGGAVFCSFATPNLSFWKLMPLPDGRTSARALPVFDRGMPLDRSKSYVLLETNEGDTPRIVVSAFSKSWTDPRRGSLPVSWSIDPVLATQFPALFDFFASTAGVNDSFVSGPGGCGYVYYGRMTDAQIATFATRCGWLMREFGPAVIDTFGQTGPGAQTFSVLTNFSGYAGAAGSAPLMYITQPTDCCINYASFNCVAEASLDLTLPDSTPLICTDPSLFYVGGGPGCVACAISTNVNKVAAANKPPFFITVYGGLKWTSSDLNPDNEFVSLRAGEAAAAAVTNALPYPPTPYTRRPFLPPLLYPFRSGRCGTT